MIISGSEGAPSASSLEAHLPEGRSYSGSRALFREAAHLFGVDLSQQEDTDWRSLLDGAALVDHLLDVEKIDIVPPLRTIAAGNYREDLRFSSQVRFAAYLERQPVETTEAIFAQLGRVNELVTAQREETRAKGLVDIRIDEADILTALLALPHAGKPDETNRKTFNRWLNSWSRTGYLVDSLVDLADDFEAGESRVKPTMRARAVVGQAACREGMTALHRTPYRLFGKVAVNATKYVLMNVKPDVTAQT